VSNSEKPDPENAVENAVENVDEYVADEYVAEEYVADENADEEYVADENAVEDVAIDDLEVVTADTDTASPVVAARPGGLRNRALAVAGALLLASLVAAGSVYWFLYRPDRLTDEAVQEQVLEAARVGTEAVLSYSSASLDENLAAAKSHLTGNFLEHYSQFTDTVVRPAVTQKGVKTEASVARAAISQMRPGKAEVLVFVNQVTTSKDRPAPALATSSVMMTLVKSQGSWLISEFNPV
jgi:Mce-associated membrane protein